MVALKTNGSFPTKGWHLLYVDDVHPEGEFNADDYATCEFCNHRPVRYVHVVEYVDGEQLAVGCVCAERLSGDDETPRALQRQVMNRARRKKVPV